MQFFGSSRQLELKDRRAELHRPEEKNVVDESPKRDFGSSGIVSSPEDVNSLEVSPNSESEPKLYSVNKEIKVELNNERTDSPYKVEHNKQLQALRKELEQLNEIESEAERSQMSSNKKTHSSKSISKTLSNKTAWLRSLKRLGDTVENEYKIIKRLDIGDVRDWISLEESLSKLEKKKEVIKKVKKKACDNCVDLLFRGQGTDLCKRRGTRKHNAY